MTNLLDGHYIDINIINMFECKKFCTYINDIANTLPLFKSLALRALRSLKLRIVAFTHLIFFKCLLTLLLYIKNKRIIHNTLKTRPEILNTG